MATFYTNSGNQRDGNPMIYLPGAYSDAAIVPANVMMYNSLSDSLAANSQHPSCIEISSLESLNPSQQHHDILSNLGGHVFRDEMLMMNSTGGQGLSLSLGTQIPSAIQIPSISYRNLSSRDDQPRNPDYHDTSKGEMSYGLMSAAKSIPNSKYLKAAQQLLDELVSVRKTAREGNQSTQENAASGSRNDLSNPQDSPHELSSAEKQELQSKLTKLLSMLDEVDRRYKQYYHQMQIVVSSFDVIAGSGSAKPYTALALHTISRHFRCVRDALAAQIAATRRQLGEHDASEAAHGVGIPRLRYVDQQLRQQRAIQQLGMMQQHAWRPQRGLPETSVSILRAWLFEHFLHPYPKDSDKIMLARQTGLTRSQVSNWFINARVRLWKPMVEEMYKEEMGDAEMDSNSSSENAAKAASKGGSEDRDDLQQSASSDHVHAMEMAMRMRMEQKQPTIDECSLYVQSDATYPISDASRYGVSLTLGLQHCEGAASHSFVPMREDDIYVGAASSVGADPSGSEFECGNPVNGRQSRFSTTHLLHDFVA